MRYSTFFSALIFNFRDCTEKKIVLQRFFYPITSPERRWFRGKRWFANAPIGGNRVFPRLQGAQMSRYRNSSAIQFINGPVSSICFDAKEQRTIKRRLIQHQKSVSVSKKLETHRAPVDRWNLRNGKTNRTQPRRQRISHKSPPQTPDPCLFFTPRHLGARPQNKFTKIPPTSGLPAPVFLFRFEFPLASAGDSLLLFRTSRISPSDPPGPKQVYKLVTVPHYTFL